MKDPCKSGLDLAFVIDKSSSIGKRALAKLYKGFLPLFLSKLPISKKKTHVGIVHYSSKAELSNSFKDKKYQNKKELISKVKNFQPVSHRGTRMDRGLKMALDKLFTRKGGDRKGKQNVVVVIGDGRNRPHRNLERRVTPLRVRESSSSTN